LAIDSPILNFAFAILEIMVMRISVSLPVLVENLIALWQEQTFGI